MAEQLKIDLMNLSKPKLLSIAKDEKIEIATTMNKDAIIDILHSKLNDDKLREISKDYIYAGKTSVSLWKYTIESDAKLILNKSNIAETLTKLCEGKKPFEKDLRPDLTNDPQINSANFLNESTCRIQFVSKGAPKRGFEGYDHKTIDTIIFTNAILDFDSQLLEVRTDSRTAKKAAKIFFAKLNKLDDANYTHKQFEIDLNQAIKLKEAVNGYMSDHSGKEIGDEKPYGKMKMSKSPVVPDLWEDDRFQADRKSMDTTSLRIQFASPFDKDGTVSIDVSTMQSSIYFRSFASEDDINYVFEKLMSLSN